MLSWRGLRGQIPKLYIAIVAIALLVILFGLFGNSVAAPDKNPSFLNDNISIIPVTNSSNSSKVVPGSIALNGGSTITALPAMHQGLINSSDPELRKLAEYEQASGSGIADGMLLFTDVPATQTEANEHAAELMGSMKEFAKFQITPIVIFEPTTDDGNLDFQAYSNGKYDTFVETLFTDLKKSGLSDSEIGTWVLFSEGNTPLWGNTDPGLFASGVTRTAQIQKNVFPTSQSSVLLNSQTYSSDDTDWANGTYSSLVPYLKNIPAGLIDSFGLQGFPWAPPANDTGSEIFDAAQFLPLNLAEQAANQLGVKHIWFNTGTFGLNYTNDKSKLISVPYASRQQTLNTIASQAQQLSREGYKVTVSLFAQDKSNQQEATDWSYWNSNNFSTNGEGREVYSNFAVGLYGSGIELWLFDTD